MTDPKRQSGELTDSQLCTELTLGGDVPMSELRDLASARLRELLKENKTLQERCGELEGYKSTIKLQDTRILEQRERIAALEGALTGLLQITEESNGVVGYHLNGDVAAWGEFEEVANAEAVLQGQALAPGSDGGEGQVTWHCLECDKAVMQQCWRTDCPLPKDPPHPTTPEDAREDEGALTEEKSDG